MNNGLYQVTYGSICAGFIIRNGQLDKCAPILRNKIHYWKKFAVRVGD